MHYSKLSLIVAAVLASVGASRLTAQATVPEFESLLTESTVTLSYTLTTSKSVTSTVSGGTRIVTSADTFPITPQQVLRSLQLKGQIPDAPAITATSPGGWQLVAVRPIVTDLADAVANYDLYAKNETAGLRVRINDALNLTYTYNTQSYTEQHIGGYPISGKGFTNNYVELNHNLQIIRSGTVPVTYTIDKLLSWGTATLTFQSVDEPVFHFPIGLLRLSGVGEFSGASVTPAADIAGLAVVNFQIGTPKLVYASVYPDTSPENVMTANPFNPFFVTP